VNICQVVPNKCQVVPNKCQVMEPSWSLRLELYNGAMTGAHFMTGAKKPVIYNNFIQFYAPFIFILLFISLGTILLSPKRIINNNIFS